MSSSKPSSDARQRFRDLVHDLRAGQHAAMLNVEALEILLRKSGNQGDKLTSERMRRHLQMLRGDMEKLGDRIEAIRELIHSLL